MTGTVVTGEVVARSPSRGLAWIRVPTGKAHKILLLDDDVIPWGLKSARFVSVQFKSDIETNGTGYTADIEVGEAGATDEGRTDGGSDSG